MKKLVLTGSAALLVLGLAAAAGCGSDSIKDDFVDTTFDAGSEAGSDAATGSTDGGSIDLTLGGPCVDDAQCDDAIDCTNDRCDQSISRCRNAPDNTKCDDGKYCDGAEQCVARQGCAPGPVMTCEDSNGCTIDTCVEASQSCTHTERDVDGDGDPDDHCVAGRDCDDTNPNVSSLHAEICGNRVDDNCNGQIDETPCSAPANDICATAQAITAPGSFLLSTVATRQDYATTCAPNTANAQDIVVAITVPAGAAQNVLVHAAASTHVAIVLEATCAAVNPPLFCVNFSQNDARGIAHDVAGGSTVYAILTTFGESQVNLDVSFQAGTPAPTNETCASPQPIALNTPIAVSLVGTTRDIPTDPSCTSTIGDLTYSFTIAQPQDVKIYASTTIGTGNPIVSLRDQACADISDEITCSTSTVLPLFRRKLAAGTYTIAVSADGPIDESVVVQALPPTDPPADQFCASAPAAALNATFPVDLSNHEGTIDDGCSHAISAGSPTATRLISLTQTSDVLIVGRFPQAEYGEMGLGDEESCTVPNTANGNTFCAKGSVYPERISEHALAAGNYHLVITDQLGQTATAIVLARPTLDPVTVTADNCTDVGTAIIPPTGGYFTGDTSKKAADFNAGCDANNQPVGTAKDQLMKLVLTKTQRVVFDTSYSTFQTIIDIRSGEPCPGVEVDGACASTSGVGNSSFLDITLDAGTYYVQIDGYNGASGPWTLDVRVLDPADAGTH